jgi:hypothetical protein
MVWIAASFSCTRDTCGRLSHGGGIVPRCRVVSGDALGEFDASPGTSPERHSLGTGRWLSRPCQSITAMRTSRAAAEHVTSESLDIWQRKMKGPSFGGPTDAMIQRTGGHRRRVPDARAATVPAPTSPRAFALQPRVLKIKKKTVLSARSCHLLARGSSHLRCAQGPNKT